MKFLSAFVLLATLSLFAEAASLQHDNVHRSNHNGISRRANNNTRRCKQRRPPTTKTETSTKDEPKKDEPKKDEPKKDEPKDEPKKDEPKKDEPKDEPKNVPAPNTGGLIKVQDGRCGPNGATQQVTKTTGPNGSIDWLNCGIEGAGWNPPFLRVTDLVTVNLDDAIAKGGPFAACGPYVWAFKEFGNKLGLPPILLASIALQESSCNPNTVGGAGEQGLMQLTHDKCPSNGDCKDVGYNVGTGAKYFADTLAANGGNFLLTLGGYNGWQKGMNTAYATRMRSSHCRAQNNLDYLFQTVNGWLLNNDAYSMHLGKYFNLDVC